MTSLQPKLKNGYSVRSNSIPLKTLLSELEAQAQRAKLKNS